MNNNNYNQYTSPFSWRYGSAEMRKIWSEENKYRLWRKIWVELARAQSQDGLVSQEELADLEKHQPDLDIERIFEIEKDTKHDVVAAIQEFAEKAKKGGGKIHLGATSMDITDNAETIRISESLNLIEKNLALLLKIFGQQIKKYADSVSMGYTHLQPAEPTTLGYRLAIYGQDLLMDWELLQFVKDQLKTKGMKGAVGTGASYVSLMGLENAQKMEEAVLGKLGIKAASVTNQTAPRKVEVWVSNLLSSIAQSLNKFAFDVRVMQSAGFGEWQEPFGKSQVGSSAMPFKRNPIISEKICSLARLVVSLSRVSWDNAAQMLLERTLDDSANRRVVIPEMFLSCEEMLISAAHIMQGLNINEEVVRKNVEFFWLFSASELIIVEAVKKGADRQKMHELLRKISMESYQTMHQSKENPIKDLLLKNETIGKYLNSPQILEILDIKNHTGYASERALTIVKKIDSLKTL